MKRILLSATGCLSLLASVTKAQTTQPCNTYKAQEIYTKTIPGYKAKLDAVTAQSAAEYQAYLNKTASRTAGIPASYTFTIPVVFHILHMGGSENIPDADCIAALDLVNKDYARMGNDTNLIDPLFDTAYINSRIHFELAKKDPYGNCTNGIVHHYNANTNWDQGNVLYSYIYSNLGTYNWVPSRYLNVYVVKNIIDDGTSGGQIIGYTHLPGTAPNLGSDAIVYRGDWLNFGTAARSLSHEIGHWLGLSHTFGSSNNAGVECGNDDISDTPKTTGFFSTCPTQPLYLDPTPVAIPTDSSDIVNITLGNMKSTTALNSLSSTFVFDVSTVTGTTTANYIDTTYFVGTGANGSYSNFSNESYPNDLTAGAKTISIKSLAKSTDNNYVGVYIDLNRNGSFTDAGENVYVPTSIVIGNSLVPLSTLFGTRTFSTVAVATSTPGVYNSAPATINLPSTKAMMRMRVVTSSSPITGPNMALTSGEFEDYLLNVNLPSCDTIRPNIENIMDYSGCPKMFTKGQTAKMRSTLESSIGNRDILVDTANLVFTGLLDASYNHTGPTLCAPIADFASNKISNCTGQAVIYTSTSYNSSSPISYSWIFEGGTPSTSSNAVETVTYSAPGVYGVTLTATNANGTSTKTESTYNHTFWPSDTLSLPFVESFENGVTYPNWFVTNNDFGSITWETGNYGSQGSSKCLMLPNANGGYFFGDIDIIESKQFNFYNTTGITFAFDYSYARKTGTTQDTFKLQYSLDCGGTWNNVPGSPTAAQMAVSGGTLSAPYVPWTQNKWVTKTIAPALLGALNNKRDVKFRFYFRNDKNTGSAQNLYIDNINISGVVGIEELGNSIGLSIFPNPTNASSTVEFTSPVDSKVDVLVHDVTGRLVEENQFRAAAGNTTSYTINQSSKLHAGVYFVTLSLDGQKITKKLIIQ